MGELPSPNLDYMSLSHEELFENVKNVEPGAIGEAGAIWSDQAKALFDLGQDMQSALNRESASWRGETAEAVFDFSTKVAKFAEETGEQDMKSTETSEISAESSGQAKHAMPEPTGFDRQAELQEAARKITSGDMGGVSQLEALDAKQRAAEEAHRRAAEVSTAHAETLYDAHSRGFDFGDPPKLSDSEAAVRKDGSRVGSVDPGATTFGSGATSASSAPGTAAPPVSGGTAAPPVGGPGGGGGPTTVPGPGQSSGVGTPPGGAPPGGNPATGGPGGIRPGMPVAPIGAGGVRGARGGDTPRTNKSPFAPTGRAPGAAAARPGQGLAGQRLTGGGTSGGQSGAGTGGKGAGATPGKGTGASPGSGAGRPEYGARAAAAGAGSGRAGMGPMAGAAGRGGKGEDDEEHKDKYFVPEEFDDGLHDETAGYDKDPTTGMTVVRPVIGEAGPQDDTK